MALTPGTRLGVYEVTAQIGEGGMGQVFRARDTKLNRDVALKILPDSFANDPDRFARFTREAQTLAALNHPNIAHIHGLEESGGVRALVMELVEGEDLSQQIARGAIPLDEALPIAKQIADALEAAHEQGIIHRDLKPANIKVKDDGTVKVLDFGLAKAMDPPASSPNVSQSPTITTPAMTQAGMILGTAAYMSPEQAKGRPADKRSDVWAFGCVLYEMLTGRRAFEGEDVTETFAFILTREPDWAGLPTGTPSPIRRLLRRCLEKSVKRRLADAADASLEIDDALNGSFVDTAGGIPPSQSWRLMPWVIAGLAVLASAVFILRRPASTAAVQPIVFTVDAPRGTGFTSRAFSTGPVISPDGRSIAFIADRVNERPSIWIRSVDATEARVVAGTENADGPFWAPDSRSLGFFADGRIKTVSVGGGPARTVASTEAFGGGTWNRDDVIVFSTGPGQPLRRVRSSGGETGPVTKIASTGAIHLMPSFLPDGMHFLFLAKPENRIYVGSLDSSIAVKDVAATAGKAVYAPPGFLLYAQDNRLLVARRFDLKRLEVMGDPIPLVEGIGVNPNAGRAPFSVSTNGMLAYVSGRTTVAPLVQLAWFDRLGRELQKLGQPDQYRNPSLSPDGKQIAVQVSDSERSSLWLVNSATGVATRFTSGMSDRFPVWARDSARIAFVTERGSRISVLERTASGDAERVLQDAVSKDDVESPADWTPDGRSLVLEISRPGQTGFATVASGDNRQATELLLNSHNNRQAQLSPDGRWLAYVSDDESRAWNVVLQRIDGTGRRQLSTLGGSHVRWRRDGREVLYISPDGSLMAVGVDTKTGTVASPSRLFATGVMFPGVSVAGWRQQFDVTGDGQRFLFASVVEDPSPSQIRVMVNWTATLEK